MYSRYDSTSHFDDVWELSLKEMEMMYPSSVVDEERDDLCAWREKSIYHHNEWTSRCGYVGGTNPAQDCSIHDIIIKAWCQENYQVFQNL